MNNASRNNKRWSEKDIEYLRMNYPTMPSRTLCVKLKRGFEGIRSAASKYGIERPRRKGTLFYSNGKPRYRVLANGCWQWTAGVNKKGYPIARGKNTTLAHRQIYIDNHGPIPDEMDVDHVCRYRRCVNVEHLEAVTHLENILRSSKTKLTHDDVTAIRADQKTPTSELAKRYGVWPSTIYFARKGTTWKS